MMCDVCVAKDPKASASYMHAKRRCPFCRRALCNNHSKRASDLRDPEVNRDRRMCSGCHAHPVESSFVEIGDGA
jgi:hypothetical protein